MTPPIESMIPMYLKRIRNNIDCITTQLYRFSHVCDSYDQIYQMILNHYNFTIDDKYIEIELYNSNSVKIHRTYDGVWENYCDSSDQLTFYYKIILCDYETKEDDDDDDDDDNEIE